MTTTTADQFPLFTDPTDSFEFKAFFLLDSIITKARLRVLIELTRLSFLGFYDRFEKFLEQLQLAEDEAIGEETAKAVVGQRLHLAASIETLLARLDPMTRITFKGSNLGEYVAGKDRIDTLRLFIKSARIDQQAEDKIEQSKVEFLSSFARRRLTKHQQSLLVEKYRKFSIGQ